ncbi:MAG: hypothetical protein K0R80_2149 [Clostridia bacterium]|nr:hypothetical protein [Clostridia bacterium]
MGRGFYHARRAFARSVTHELTKGKRTTTNRTSNKKETLEDMNMYLPPKLFWMYWIVAMSVFILPLVFTDTEYTGAMSFISFFVVYATMSIHSNRIKSKKEAYILEEKRRLRLEEMELERQENRKIKKE